MILNLVAGGPGVLVLLFMMMKKALGIVSLVEVGRKYEESYSFWNVCFVFRRDHE